jgi:hypothetical protein
MFSSAGLPSSPEAVALLPLVGARPWMLRVPKAAEQDWVRLEPRRASAAPRHSAPQALVEERLSVP